MVNDFQARKDHAQAIAVEEEDRLAKTIKHLENVQEAQEYLQKIAAEVQHLAHTEMARVVSRCLTAVFKRPYELRIEFDKKRGKTEARFLYLRDGRKINPKTSSGGVLQVASLALRLVKMVMTLPPTDKILILDEPMAGLSESNLKKMALLVETLAEELDCQFVIATHSEALMIGKVIQLD